MFFLFSKLLLYFIYPLTWVLILLMLRLIVRSQRAKKRLLVASLIIFILFSNAWVLNQFAKVWDYKPAKLPAGSHYSCVIILGGFSVSSPEDSGYFNVLADRFIQAASLYKQGIADHILMTGGSGSVMKENFREADWANKQFLKLGIPQSDILLENKSRNTLENGAFTKNLLDSLHLKPPYLLVTSAFHMRRSVWVFQKEGVPVVPYPSNYMAGVGKFSLMDVLPQAMPLDVWTLYIKEVIGCAAYYIKSKL